jgi:hypothetical protein
MDAKLNEVELNGVKYVPKECQSNPVITKDYCIVRTNSAGVHAGELVSKEGDLTVLRNARRLYYWDGAATLSQLAMEGVSKPENCKFPCEVTLIELLGTIERIPCTEKAIQSIKGVKIWKH